MLPTISTPADIYCSRAHLRPVHINLRRRPYAVIGCHQPAAVALPADFVHTSETLGSRILFPPASPDGFSPVRKNDQKTSNKGRPERASNTIDPSASFTSSSSSTAEAGRPEKASRTMEFKASFTLSSSVLWRSARHQDKRHKNTNPSHKYVR